MTTTARAKIIHCPLVFVAVCFALGILLDEYTQIPPVFSCVWIIAAIVAALWLRNRVYLPLVLVLLVFIAVGHVHARGYAMRSPDHIDHMAWYFYEIPIRLEGVVASDVTGRRWRNIDKTTFRLNVQRLYAHGRWHKTRGQVLVNIFRKQALCVGDYLVAEGKPHKPFDFSSASRSSYRDYLEHKGIKFILSVKKQGSLEILATNRGNLFIVGLARWKGRLNNILERHFSGAALGVMQGFLLGDRYNIPGHINELFRLSGVTHILAVSGFNVGIVTYATFLFFKILPLGRRWHYLLTMLMIILYAILTGAQPPVVRAAVMASVFLASFILEVETQSLNTLACAALILLWMNPLNLFDIGFQLSFVSVWAIIVIYPRFMSILCGNGKTQDSTSRNQSAAVMVLHYGRQSLALSCAAYLGVAVLIAYYFELVTPVAILANLMVIPLASVIVILGMVFLIIGLVLPTIAFLFAQCIQALLAIMVGVIALCIQIPGAHFQVRGLTAWVVIVYYLSLFLFLWLTDRRPRRHFHPTNAAAIFLS